MIRAFPGQGSAIVGDGVVAIVQAAGDDPFVRQVSSGVLGGTPIVSMLGELARGGLGRAPDFAFVVLMGGAPVRVVHRGNLDIALLTDGGGQVGIDPPDVLTWQERVVPAGSTVQVRLPRLIAGVGEPAPIGAGVHEAGGLLVGGASATGAFANGTSGASSLISAVPGIGTQHRVGAASTPSFSPSPPAPDPVHVPALPPTAVRAAAGGPSDASVHAPPPALPSARPPEAPSGPEWREHAPEGEVPWWAGAPEVAGDGRAPTSGRAGEDPTVRRPRSDG